MARNVVSDGEDDMEFEDEEQGEPEGDAVETDDADEDEEEGSCLVNPEESEEEEGEEEEVAESSGVCSNMLKKIWKKLVQIENQLGRIERHLGIGSSSPQPPQSPSKT